MYSVAMSYNNMVSSGCPKLVLLFTAGYDVLGVVWQINEGIMIHYPRPRDRTAKLVIRFEVALLVSRGYFLKCSHLHCPKGDWINARAYKRRGHATHY